MASLLFITATINATPYKVSLEGIKDSAWWDAQVKSFRSLYRSLEHEYGGYCRINLGDIIFSPELFENEWVPPDTITVKAEHSITDYSGAIELFESTAFRNTINLSEIVYSLVEKDYGVDLLGTDTDYNGDTVPLPRAFGTVTHVNPVRLPDRIGAPTYHKGYVSGVISTNWHVYDDGVNIDANVTDNGDGTFSLSAIPVGEVTLSGIGVDTNLSDIFDWACEAGNLNLTYDNTYAEAPSPSVEYWEATQRTMLNFLSEISAYFSHMFYIDENSGTLYLIEMIVANGTRTLTAFDKFEDSVTYTNNDYTYQVKTNWIERQAVSDATGNHVKDFDMEESVISSFEFGKVVAVNTFQATRSDINDQLTKILTTLNMPIVQIKIPIENFSSAPGEEISYVDQQLVTDLNVTFYVDSIKYDFDEDKIELSGRGILT